VTDSPDLPRVFGRYVLTQLIGEGGMAEVYLATVQVAAGLTKRVVIKKIRQAYADHDEFTRMFVDEAKIALSLNHANIVQVFDFGQAQGAFYLAMEQVEGVDAMRLFHAVSDSGERIPPVVAAYIGHQVAAALAYAHRKTDDHGEALGLVHRDISPHNVMVSFEGQVKILDFGIARTTGASRKDLSDTSEHRAEETIKGKVAYMSPEQAHGLPVDQRSDVYSLGVLLYELLTGELVFRSHDRLAALERVRNESLVSLRECAANLPEALPEPLVEIVDQALARDPDARYATARAMQSELAKFLHRADPVVDDDTLSQFVLRYFTPAPPPIIDESALPRDATRGGQTSYPSMRGVPARIVVVHMALDAHPLMPDDGPVEAEPFLRLVEDVAFKRDAVLFRKDESGVTLAFGAVLQSPDDADRGLRCALSLQDDVAQMAPGLRVGAVVARVRATVTRENNTVQVKIRDEVGEQLHRIATGSMEEPVRVAGPLIEALSKGWRFGPEAFVEPDVARTQSVVDRELENVAPVLGPATQAVRARAAAPGGRALLFGRELELKALRDTFSEAIRSRESRAVVVLGEAGVGKRALVERFVASLPRTACWVLRASGTYARRNVPLGVFLDLLTRFLGTDHRSDEAEVVGKLQSHGVSEAAVLGAALASALGLKGTAADGGDDDLDPFTRRDRLWKLVRRLTTVLAQRRPVLIVVENLHLHDEQSIALLREWVQLKHGYPVLGVTTGRPGAPRVDAILSEPNIARIELGELDAQARRELVSSRFEDTAAAREFTEALVAQTGGNPLFIEESLASLLEAGVIGWNAQGSALTVKQRGAPIRVPPSVEAALVERIERLPSEDREALLGGAVLGRAFRTHELADLLERSVGRSIDRLIERNLLERLSPPSPLAENARFATVSLHEACKGMLEESAAHALHVRAAHLIRERPDYAAERDDGPIADHLVQAGRAAEAIEPALAAALRAYDLAGNVEAYYHLSQALRAMEDDDPRRWDALLRRERILRAWGRRRAQGADVRALLRTADAEEDPHKQAIASIRLLRFYLEVGRVHQAERLIPRIETRLEALAKPDPFWAVLGELRSELFFAKGDFEAAETTARAGLPYCASDARGQRQRCRLLRSIGQVKATIGRFAQARQCYTEALNIAREIGNQRLEANLLNALGEVAGRSTHYQEAVDSFKAALAIDRDLGDRYATGRKLANLGITYACIGLSRRAERFLRKALELHEAVGHPGEFNDAAVHLGEVVADGGDVETARTLLLDAARVAGSRGDIRTELRARVRLAQALRAGDATDEDRKAARVTAEQVLTTARAQGLRTSTCRALHTLAQLDLADGDHDSAQRRLEEAVELVRAGAAPLDGVRSIHLLGVRLRDAGQHDDARALLHEAALMVRARLDELRDADLRSGYLEQPEVRQILTDGGLGDDATAQ
jgi:serine/threonine protein kinase/tetratricopeptide (TPR) repeat protein